VEVLTILLILSVAVVSLVKVASGSGPGGGSEIASLFSLPENTGTSAVFAAMVFGFLSFAGFEAASTLGEETRNPRRTIPIALMGTVALAGVFFVIVTSAVVLGFGTSADGTAAITGSGSLVGDLGRMYITGAVGDAVTLGAGISAFGSALACTVGASRLLFAMGRDGFITTKLGATRDRDGVPQQAVNAILASALVILLALRVLATDQVIDVFFWSATLGSLALLVAYFMSLVGAGRFLFLRTPRRAPLVEAVIPVAGMALIAYVLYRNVWPIPDSPYNTFPYIVAAWVVIGLVVVIGTPGLARRIGERLVFED
jgi:amino acid transporter